MNTPKGVFFLCLIKIITIMKERLFFVEFAKVGSTNWSTCRVIFQDYEDAKRCAEENQKIEKNYKFIVTSYPFWGTEPGQRL